MTADRGSKKTSAELTFDVTTEARPQFDTPLVAHVFDANGELLETAKVKSKKLALKTPESLLRRGRIFLAPEVEGLEGEALTPSRLERLGAYEPVLVTDEGLTDRIRIPGDLLSIWPFCFCWVRGRVVRSSDGRPVCDARVHVCEVDRVPWWILRLPELDLLRLRDDLLRVLRKPPIPKPLPIPDPPPYLRPLFRFEGGVPGTKLNPQPEPPSAFEAPGSTVGFNPQPEPPGRFVDTPMEGRAVERSSREIRLSPELETRLLSPSTSTVRDALVENWQLIVPWFCLWPWWWWRFRCDEVAVRTTDSQGRFEALVFYPCSGDKPDLYFWVEYDFGSGFETIYRPPIACNTRWDYACGTEVTLHVSDPRVPGCGGEGDLPGCQVVIKSIGRTIAVRELQTAAAGAGKEGLTTSGQPLGGTLEFRVDFSRTCLIEDKNIPYYRWSYRRLSGPDGITPDPGAWTPMTRDVYRHYKVGTSYPSMPMGPLPTTGPDPAPLPDLFRIRPADPPVGSTGWEVWDEHIDLATAYFATAGLSGAPTSGPSGNAPAPDDTSAGRYEVKLELFDEGGNLVNWTAKGIDLRIPQQNAPFPPDTITTEPVPSYNRILDGGDTVGFRMVLRIDNNRCFADIHPVAGDVPPDPQCGFNEYGSLSDDVRLSFVARHPNHFAHYFFVTRRATGPDIGSASSSGIAGEAGTNGFLYLGGFGYQKDVSVGTLLSEGASGDPCEQAAFSERLHVRPMVTNGYTILWGYRHDDVAAFALAKPCECPGQGQGGGVGGGRGSGVS